MGLNHLRQNLVFKELSEFVLEELSSETGQLRHGERIVTASAMIALVACG